LFDEDREDLQEQLGGKKPGSEPGASGMVEFGDPAPAGDLSMDEFEIVQLPDRWDPIVTRPWELLSGDFGMRNNQSF
jgi:hypothetical protein